LKWEVVNKMKWNEKINKPQVPEPTQKGEKRIRMS
jgi:hypothetical protein